jgi:hypothetical protein
VLVEEFWPSDADKVFRRAHGPSELGGDRAKGPAVAEQGLGVFEDAGAGVLSGGGLNTTPRRVAICSTRSAQGPQSQEPNSVVLSKLLVIA